MENGLNGFPRYNNLAERETCVIRKAWSSCMTFVRSSMVPGGVREHVTGAASARHILVSTIPAVRQDETARYREILHPASVSCGHLVWRIHLQPGARVRVFASRNCISSNPGRCCRYVIRRHTAFDFRCERCITYVHIMRDHTQENIPSFINNFSPQRQISLRFQADFHLFS